MKLHISAENNGLSAFQRLLQFFIPPHKKGVGCRFLILCKGITNNGRCIIADFKRAPQRFHLFCLVLRVCLGIFGGLSPFPALAEFNDTDSTRLFNLLNKADEINVNLETLKQFQNASLSLGGAGVATIANEIETNTFQMYNKLVNIHNALGYSGSYDSDNLKLQISFLKDYLAALGGLNQEILKGLGGSGQKWVGDSLGFRLDKIIAAIESLEDTGTGSGGETPEIPTDIATETTLSAFKGQYEQLANQLLNSFGFTPEHNLKSYFDNFFTSGNYTWTTRIFTQPAGTSEGPMTPFPIKTPVAPGYKWFNTSPGSFTTSQSFNNVFEWLQFAQDEMHGRYFLYTQSLFKKEAWNDWYAHTNMVAQIISQVDRFVLPPEQGRQDSTFNSETGTIETPSYGSSSAVVDIKPAYTNDFVQIEESSNSLTNSFQVLNYETIKSRYISDEMLSMGEFQDYGIYGGGFNGVWKIGGFVIDFSNLNTYYREIITVSTLSKVREAMSYIWIFCSILAAFWFVVKIGGISQD